MLKAVRNGQPVVSPNSGPVAQLGARFHGMEEVVGSIPTRSTNSLNNLDGASPRDRCVCVMVCVITRRFGAHSQGFHRCPLRFHPHVAVPFQHAQDGPPGKMSVMGILQQLSARKEGFGDLSFVSAIQIPRH